MLTSRESPTPALLGLCPAIREEAVVAYEAAFIRSSHVRSRDKWETRIEGSQSPRQGHSGSNLCIAELVGPR